MLVRSFSDAADRSSSGPVSAASGGLIFNLAPSATVSLEAAAANKAPILRSFSETCLWWKMRSTDIDSSSEDEDSEDEEESEVGQPFFVLDSKDVPLIATNVDDDEEDEEIEAEVKEDEDGNTRLYCTCGCGVAINERGEVVMKNNEEDQEVDEGICYYEESKTQSDQSSNDGKEDSKRSFSSSTVDSGRSSGSGTLLKNHASKKEAKKLFLKKDPQCNNTITNNNASSSSEAEDSLVESSPPASIKEEGRSSEGEDNNLEETKTNQVRIVTNSHCEWESSSRTAVSASVVKKENKIPSNNNKVTVFVPYVLKNSLRRQSLSPPKESSSKVKSTSVVSSDNVVICGDSQVILRINGSTSVSSVPTSADNIPDASHNHRRSSAEPSHHRRLLPAHPGQSNRARMRRRMMTTTDFSELDEILELKQTTSSQQPQYQKINGSHQVKGVVRRRKDLCKLLGLNETDKNPASNIDKESGKENARESGKKYSSSSTLKAPTDEIKRVQKLALENLLSATNLESPAKSENSSSQEKFLSDSNFSRSMSARHFGSSNLGGQISRKKDLVKFLGVEEAETNVVSADNNRHNHDSSNSNNNNIGLMKLMKQSIRWKSEEREEKSKKFSSGGLSSNLESSTSPVKLMQVTAMAAENEVVRSKPKVDDREISRRIQNHLYRRRSQSAQVHQKKNLNKYLGLDDSDSEEIVFIQNRKTNGPMSVNEYLDMDGSNNSAASLSRSENNGSSSIVITGIRIQPGEGAEVDEAELKEAERRLRQSSDDSEREDGDTSCDDVDDLIDGIGSIVDVKVDGGLTTSSNSGGQPMGEDISFSSLTLDDDDILRRRTTFNDFIRKSSLKSHEQNFDHSNSNSSSSKSNLTKSVAFKDSKLTSSSKTTKFDLAESLSKGHPVFHNGQKKAAKSAKLRRAIPLVSYGDSSKDKQNLQRQLMAQDQMRLKRIKKKRKKDAERRSAEVVIDQMRRQVELSSSTSNSNKDAIAVANSSLDWLFEDSRMMTSNDSDPIYLDIFKRTSPHQAKAVNGSSRGPKQAASASKSGRIRPAKPRPPPLPNMPISGQHSHYFQYHQYMQQFDESSQEKLRRNYKPSKSRNESSNSSKLQDAATSASLLRRRQIFDFQELQNRVVAHRSKQHQGSNANPHHMYLKNVAVAYEQNNNNGNQQAQSQQVYQLQNDQFRF